MMPTFTYRAMPAEFCRRGIPVQFFVDGTDIGELSRDALITALHAIHSAHPRPFSNSDYADTDFYTVDYLRELLADDIAEYGLLTD